MNNRRWVRISALAVVLSGAAITVAGAHTAPPKADSLGAVDFRVSCDPAARADFDRALGYLHHMMYVEAEREFGAVAAKYPDCAMAHWGIAASLFQPLWPTRPSATDLERGRQEVALAEKLEPSSEREQALLQAADAFFRAPGETDWWARIGRWAESMEKAYQAHSRDLDIAAFYALSQLAVAQVADDRARYNSEAAKILLAIHKEAPTHPGAIHYTIHANDAEGRAGDSLDVVRAYGDIAPSVPHALHMPTHIFVRLGDWPEVIAWNRKSADAALRFPAGETVSHHYLHAIDYLVYAHLQRGEDSTASALLAESRTKGEHQPSFISAFHLAAMPARFAIERRVWKEAAAIEPRKPATIPWDKFAWPEGLSWFARGLGAVHTGDVAEARAAEAKLAALRDGANAAGEKNFASYVEIDRLILAGRIARAEGKDDEAIARMRESAELELAVEKHPVTPGALLPPREALGDLLLELDRGAQALETYEASLKIWPQRYNSLLGAARAAQAAGDEVAAKNYYSRLIEIAGAASSREGITEAKRIVDQR